MENNYFNTKTDDIIRNSMRLADEPAPELNQKLKAALYQQEVLMQKQPAVRVLSFWYLPMILNLAMFIMLAVAALMAISNVYLSYFTAGICLYIGLSGVLLTVVGIRRANLKEDMAVQVEKRGVLA